MVTLNGVKPKNSKEGKIWNKYNNNLSGYEWDWYLIRHWPRNLAQAVISEDLCYMERWQLWLYFVGNGMSPTQGTDMVLDIGDKYFDKAAIAHVQSFNDEHLEANARKWRYWDEIQGRTRVLADSLVLDKITHSEYKKQWRNNNEDRVNDFWYNEHTEPMPKAPWDEDNENDDEKTLKSNRFLRWYFKLNKDDEKENAEFYGGNREEANAKFNRGNRR